MARETARAAGRGRGQRWLLGSLTLATFVVSASTVSITPFLLAMGADLSADLAAVGALVAVQNLTWGVGSLAAGVLSDRVGRRPILFGGLLALAVSSVGVAGAGTYGVAALWRVFGGMFGGAFVGAVYAAAADLSSVSGRGRALGWIMVGQSLSLVLGVPLLTLLGAFGGWRGALLGHAAAVLLAALNVWLVIPGGRGTRSTPTVPARQVLRLLRPPVAALLVSTTLERVCYSAVVVFLPTFLLATYGVSLQELAGGLAVVAIGNLLGNVVGGQLSDRLSARLATFAVSLFATGLLALPLLFWHPSVVLSIGLGFVYTLVNAIGRPSLYATVSAISNEARGSILGLNITFSSWGWILASTVGGWLVTGPGFGALGMLTLAAGSLGAGLALVSWLGTPAAQRPAPAVALAGGVPAQSTGSR